MLSGCHCPVRGGVCSLVVGVEAPDLFLSCVSVLRCEVGGNGALPLGDKPLSIPPLELFTVNVLCSVPFRPLCGLTKYTVVGTALGPTLTMGMPAVGSGDSQALFSPGHWHSSTEVRSQDYSSRAPGPAVELWKQLRLAWPNLCMYVPTKPTAAKARLVPPAGALVLSDVLQALNLGSHQRRCNSAVHAAVRRDFSSSSLVTRPLGFSCGFSPTSVCSSHQSLLQRLSEHKSPSGRTEPWW